MLKNISKLEYTIADKTYTFLCEVDAPVEHVKEVLFQFQKYVGLFEDQIKAARDKAQAESKNTPPQNPEPPKE